MCACSHAGRCLFRATIAKRHARARVRLMERLRALAVEQFVGHDMFGPTTAAAPAAVAAAALATSDTATTTRKYVKISDAMVVVVMAWVIG